MNFPVAVRTWSVAMRRRDPLSGVRHRGQRPFLVRGESGGWMQSVPTPLEFLVRF